MTDLRQACDRCHDKKLKCPRPPGSICCSRCTRANVPCIFSPPTRPFRQPMSNYNGSVSFDWLDLMDLSPPLTGPSPVIAVDITPSPTILERLTMILLALDRMFQALHLSHHLHHVSRQNLREYADMVGENFHLQSTLEGLLHHTQDLVLLYPEATSAAITKKITAPEADEMCTIPDCIHQDRTSLHTTPLPEIDHALLNILIACHLRLLDVLDTLTEHGRMCSFMVATLPEDYDPKFAIPEIRIGSFIAPTNTAASMLVSILLEQKGVLIQKAKDVASAVLLASSPPKAGREARILSLQCEILQERAVATLAELNRLKNGLVGARVLK